MTFESSTGMTSSSRRTITAFFDSRDDAQEAVDELRSEGVDSADISIIEGNASGDRAGQTSSAGSYHQEGFWASLANLFMPDDDRYTYAEGLRRGGYLVTVTTNSADYDAILEILDREGTVDLDQRADEWRTSGWSASDSADSMTGVTAGSTAAAMGNADRAAFTSGEDGSRSALAGGTPRSDFAEGLDRSLSGDRSETEAIPIAEERLRIGKREINEGRIRVRSYVVETPVEEDVRLREETVSVQRRPVDQPVTGAVDPFQERTIEVEQRGEEAVVSKDARIKEELIIGKEERFRTEKVADTVRHTEVEVSDERQAGRSTTDTPATPGTGTTRQGRV